MIREVEKGLERIMTGAMAGRISILRTSSIVGIFTSLSTTVTSILQEIKGAAPLNNKIVENCKSCCNALAVKQQRKQNNTISFSGRKGRHWFTRDYMLISMRCSGQKSKA